MALGQDLVELARHLKQERLYVTSDRDKVQNLYEEASSLCSVIGNVPISNSPAAVSASSPATTEPILVPTSAPPIQHSPPIITSTIPPYSLPEGGMYQQVPEYYLALSERVSNILDVIGYSQEDRDRKVGCATGWEFFRNIEKFLESDRSLYVYIFGSRGEGSTGLGLQSDQDIVGVSDSAKIVTDLSDCQLDKRNYLMVHDDYTHPGYVKLQMVRILPDNTPDPVFHSQRYSLFRVDSSGRTVFSNQLFDALDGSSVVSGPAIQTINEIKELCSDSVFAYECARWPNEAHEWFQRRRQNGWPNLHYVQNARKDGCFACAVGHPHSFEKDLEWRLSFSITERELIRSFEDTVMKVYILLKMLKKTYIEPVLGDAFSSHHWKVCMLWVRENTPPELWCTGNLLYCLTLCIKQLYEWANMGYCPDYFIVTNNIYDTKIFGPAQVILTRVLRGLLSEGYRMLFGLECCNLGQLLLHDSCSLDIIRNSRTLNEIVAFETLMDYRFYIEEANLFRYCTLRDIPQEYNMLTRYIKRIMHVLQQVPHTLRMHLRDILISLLSRLGFHVVSVCKENAHSLSQEEMDYLMAPASKCLSLGINSDATSVRLKLCGLGTMLGDYDLTEICLQHMSDHKMRYMLSGKFGRVYTLSRNAKFTLDKCSTETYSHEELLLNQTSLSVVYLRSEISITPTPLRMEMFRSTGAPPALRDEGKQFWYDWADVDSLMCLYFFQYINFLRLGKERHQQAAIDNMIHVIRTEPTIGNRETELNLLGYCFMRESQLRNAFICFNKSLKICPHHNAAKFYLGIVFHKIHIARLRSYRN